MTFPPVSSTTPLALCAMIEISIDQERHVKPVKIGWQEFAVGLKLPEQDQSFARKIGQDSRREV
jgi:hypothetical protein